jgi:GTPase SAR1 family protein
MRIFPGSLRFGTDVFIITHSVVYPVTLDNVKSKWIEEVIPHCPGIPIILVGTKTDLRDDPEILAKLSQRGSRPTTLEEAAKFARQLKIDALEECSALSGDNVQKVFDRAIELATTAKAERAAKAQMQ